MTPHSPTSAMAVVIPIYNTRETILAQLQHLQSLGEINLADIIVVDDQSTDGSAAAIAAAFPHVPVLVGTGQLWWTGGIRLGMEFALRRNPEFLFWLNHDCRPDPGTFTKLLAHLRDPSVGCASAVCYLQKYPEYIQSPGFRNFRALAIPSTAGLLEADGVNGNCVGFRVEAIRRVGLPDAQRFPHYGDGPYTLRLRRAGLRVLVDARARVAQDHELVRCLTVFWRSALSAAPRGGWMKYYLFSNRSFYQWRYAWHRIWLYRGWQALLAFPAGLVSLLGSIGLGVGARWLLGSRWLAKVCLGQLPPVFPRQGLLRELGLAD